MELLGFNVTEEPMIFPVGENLHTTRLVTVENNYHQKASFVFFPYILDEGDKYPYYRVCEYVQGAFSTERKDDFGTYRISFFAKEDNEVPTRYHIMAILAFKARGNEGHKEQLRLISSLDIDTAYESLMASHPIYYPIHRSGYSDKDTPIVVKRPFKYTEYIYKIIGEPYCHHVVSKKRTKDPERNHLWYVDITGKAKRPSDFELLRMSEKKMWKKRRM